MKRKITLWCSLLFAVFGLLLSAHATLNLWTSAAELSSLPTSGPEWAAVQARADESTSSPNVGDQDDDTNVRVLAAAIVYARTGNAAYKTKVKTALQSIVSQGNPGDRTLAWARETGAYVLAADIIDYQSDAGDAAFRTWLLNMAENYQSDEPRTLIDMYLDRPNNWGMHGFGSLVCIYAYLQDSTMLNTVRDYWIDGVEGPNPGFTYASDKSWHADVNNLRIYNPAGAIKSGVNIDGVMPDDMRRGGSFSTTPHFTGYAWEAQQGPVMAARVLDRLGLSIYEVGDQAIYRAAYRLQVGWATAYSSQWKAVGDDSWQLPFIDAAYGSNLRGTSSDARLWDAGKNVGFGYVLLGELGAPSTVATPTFSPGAGTYSSTQAVTISSSTSGATIRYTTNGTNPTSTTGTVYSSPVSVSATGTLKAIAYKSGMTDSSVSSAAYTINSTVATPTFSPGAGTYSSTQAVTISSSTSGATIRYTTNGTNPTSTTGTVYSSPVSVSSTTTLKAIAYKSGMTDSSVATATYTISGGGGAQNFEATDDTFVQGGSATTNFNSTAYLRVKNGSGDSNDRWTYLKFDLSAYSGSVTNATLKITLKALTNGSPAVASVHQVSTDSWTESTLTWNNKPAVGALITSNTAINTINNTYSFDVTSFVNSELGGNKIVTLAIQDDNQVAKAADFYRHEDGSANAPTLVLTP